MAAEGVASKLESAQAAFGQGDFATARAHCEDALEQERTAEILDGLGQALWFLGEIEAGIARREDAYGEFRRAGDVCRAAEIALWLVVEQITSLGNETAAHGWFKRAERLLDDAPLCVAHAQLEVHRAQAAADPTDARRHCERAIEIGRELGDLDSEIHGLAQLGYMMVAAGDLEAGMSLLDEAMAAALGGELTDPWAIGSTCCSLLFACDQISDMHRAAQWCRVVIDFTQRRSYVPLSALCRSIYAGVLISTGDWERAEAELDAALKAYRGIGRPLTAYPLVRLADLRARQGRVEEAERLIAGWEDHPAVRATAISLLLSRGEIALASARLDHELARVGTEGPLAAPLLPLLVRARLAQRDVEAAQAAAERLQTLAGRLGHPHLLATAELASADVSAAGGDASAAQHLQQALDIFSQLRMPHDEARARIELARTVAEGEPDLAVAEARAALTTFERLGAARDADEAAAFLRSFGERSRKTPRLAGDLTKRETEVLGLLEEGLSNKEIAVRLYITPKTAGHHVSRILSKLGLRSRAEAAAHAARERAEGGTSK